MSINALLNTINDLISITKKKENEHFNNTIKALSNDDFPSFSVSVNNLNELRIIEIRLEEIRTNLHKAEKEVENIGKQVDTL